MINGDKLEFEKFKNKYILIVNIASKCGFSSQLKSLQLLQDKNIDDLIIIGVPSNDFMNQEPLNNSQIYSFCKINYGVTLLITEKIKVKGDLIHPLFEFLTNKDLNGWLDKAPSWNFNKYLINRVINLTDKVNKAKALRVFVRFYRRYHQNVKTVAVGDNHNDLDMLKTSDFPCLVFNDKFTLDKIPINNLIVTNKPSPEGWADVIKMALVKINKNL